jgi:hypothetical protein
MEEVEVCLCDENWESCEERENNNILIKWRRN